MVYSDSVIVVIIDWKFNVPLKRPISNRRRNWTCETGLEIHIEENISTIVDLLRIW